MRAQHILHPLPNFPIYSVTFISSNVFALGGGGGSGRTGVKNRIVRCRHFEFWSSSIYVFGQRLYEVQATLDIKELDDHELLNGDVPMSMTTHPKVLLVHFHVRFYFLFFVEI